MKPIDLTFACEMELDLTMELEHEFQDIINCKDLLDMNEFIYSFFLYVGD
jgi:hypothetical protein